MSAVGVDIGGTKTLAALVDAEGRVVSRAEAATPSASGPDAVIATASNLITALDADRDIPVGVGAAGTIDETTGTVRFATDSLPGWAGTAIADEIRRRTGLDCIVDNDVNAAAFGEAWLGAGRGRDHVLLVAAGTGLGAGLVSSGHLYRGRRNAAMEIAHLYVGDTGDAVCGCGLGGHLEAVVSGTAIARTHARDGDQVSARVVAQRAADGDHVARDVLNRAGDVLGSVLAGCVALLDVDVVVLGGSVGPALLERARTAFMAELMPTYAGVDLLPAALGADAVVVGAARMAMERRM